MLHVSWDVLRSLYVESAPLHLRRIDIYVESECVFTFFISPEYCEHIGFPSVGPVVSFETDEATFETKLTWSPDVKPCCGKCFLARYPKWEFAVPLERPADMVNGYILGDVAP